MNWAKWEMAPGKNTKTLRVKDAEAERSAELAAAGKRCVDWFVAEGRVEVGRACSAGKG